MKSLLDHKRTMNNNEESDTALYGTTNRHTNRWPLNFVGSGIRFTWGIATRGRRFDDRVRSFTRADDKGSSRRVRDYECEVFMKWNVVIWHKFKSAKHLATIVVVFLYSFVWRLTEEANRRNLSEDADRNARWMFENDVGLNILAEAVADLCDTR